MHQTRVLLYAGDVLNGIFRWASIKGSRKNKFAELVVESPDRQGAKMIGIAFLFHHFRNAAGRDESATKM